MRRWEGASREPLVAFAPGRVNLIGDHTDYTGGLALPIAVGLGTEVSYRPVPGLDHVEFTSSLEAEAAVVPLGLGAEEGRRLRPEWARYVAGVVSELAPASGGRGTIRSDLPRGAGLSSSASLEVALALALGAPATLETALSCQRAEERATGVATGPLDQVAVTLARKGCGTLIDCRTLRVEHVPVPEDLEILVCHSGVTRSVAASAYGERRRQCAAAEVLIGPLSRASLEDVSSISDALLRRRVRHVVTENHRVVAFAEALASGSLEEAGRLMSESHESLAGDFEVSVPALDDLVAFLRARPGVLGARLTGAGFGGCVVAVCRPGVGAALGEKRSFVVAPAGGATRRPVSPG